LKGYYRESRDKVKNNKCPHSKLSLDILFPPFLKGVMQKVIKISIFLFTLASTIMGQPLCLEYFPSNFGSQTSQPIATDVRRYNHNTSIHGMTNHLHINVNPYPYQIGPWNDGKNQKICPNITDELSPLPNQKSYLIESNLSPPIDNRKQHRFFPISWPPTFTIQFRLHSISELLGAAQKDKNQNQLSSSHTPHIPTVKTDTVRNALPTQFNLLPIQLQSPVT
jgi:hypothetical protein